MYHTVQHTVETIPYPFSEMQSAEHTIFFLFSILALTGG